MSDVELQELDIMIQALESNLMVFKMIQKELNVKEKTNYKWTYTYSSSVVLFRIL